MAERTSPTHAVEKAPFIVVASILGVFLGLSVVGVACGGGNGGGGDELSLEDYFAQLKTMSNELEQRGDDVESRFNADLENIISVDEAVAVLGPALVEFEQVAQDFVDSLNGLNPPAEAEELHNQLTDVYQEGAGALADLGGRLDSIESEQELATLGTDVETQFNDLGTRSDGLCFQLQDLADEQSIDVDLSCGD